MKRTADKIETLDQVIESLDSQMITDLVHKFTKGIVDKRVVFYMVEHEKSLIETRRDPGHEAWMEQR